MKLLLLHGLAIKASREKLIQIKRNFPLDNVLVFEQKTDLGQILTNLTNQSLFDSKRLVILENPPEDLSFDSLTLHDSVTLVLWFDHEVSATKPVIKIVKDVKREILYFPESKEISIFPLLDYLAAGNKNAFVEIGKLKKAGFDIYYFLTMIFYLLRNLVVTPKNAPQFVKDKLQRQRKNFSKERLSKLYKELLEIDFKIKSGLLEKDQAEFLLVNKFL